MTTFAKIAAGLAVLLLVGFLLTWIDTEQLALQGFEIGRLAGDRESFPEGLDTRKLGAGSRVFYAFYLVPLLALVVLATAFLRRGAGLAAFLTGLVTLIAFLAWLGQFQTDPRGMLGTGFWLSLLSATALLVLAVAFHLETFLVFVDRLSMWSGKIFAWSIIILTFGVSYEVFVRYALRAPTAWAYDISYMMYGALFLMAGAYTLSRDGHVRGDVLYRLWPQRAQAWIDLVLFLLFYFPGVMALIYSGFVFARMSFMFKEASVFSPAGVPVYQLKALIPIAGVILFLQGISEVVRCVRCIRTGHWPDRYHDVEEMESALQHFEEDLRTVKGEAEPTSGAPR